MTSDANIVIGIRGELEGGRRVQRTLDDIANSGDEALTSTQRLDDTVARLSASNDELARNTGGASDAIERLGRAANDSDSSVSNLEDSLVAARSNFGGLASAVRGVAAGAFLIAAAFAGVGLSSAEARAAAGDIATEFVRLVRDIDEATGASRVLIRVFSDIETLITVIRAGLATLPDAFVAIGRAGRNAFADVAQTAQDFLNDYSQAVETFSFGLREARTFTFADNLRVEPDVLQGLASYEEHLTSIIEENQRLDLEEARGDRDRQARLSSTSSALAEQAEALREQEALIRAQELAWRDAIEAINQEQAEVRELRTEAADLFADVALGTATFRDIALQAIADIGRELLRISFGGNSGGGIAGVLATGIAGIFGGGSSFDPAVSAPPPKPSTGGLGGSFSSLFGFNSGGSFTVGGTRGVDQNVLSLNGAPLARVGEGEVVSVSPGGGSNNDGVVVNQNINLSMGVDTAVQAEVARALPMIREVTQAAIRDADQRGIR